MPSIVVNQGLEDNLDNYFGDITDPVDAMSVSDFGTLLAGTTSIGSAGFTSVKALTSNNRTGQTMTLIADWPAADINGQNITTIAAHNDGAGADTGVQFGVDGQNLTFQDVDLTIEMDLTAASA